MTELPPLSASQYETFQLCTARWAAKYLGGLPDPGSAATERGKAVHAELEAWSLHGKMPTDPVALAGLPHAPAPGTALIEHELSVSTLSSPWRGFIDVLYALVNGKRQVPEWLSEEVVVQDWKTTAKAENAKTIEQLADNPQANLYAYYAFDKIGARVVRGKWVYLPVNGTKRAIPREWRFERSKVVDVVEGTLDAGAAEIQKLYKIRPKWTELPKNTDSCYAFKKQCPYMDQCKPQLTTTFSLTGATQTMNDFKANIASQFPAIPGKAPALPTKPPAIPGLPAKPPALPAKAPALPGKKPLDINQAWAERGPGAREPGVPDRSFVNSPEAPERAPRSPEEAAVQQGIQQPQAPVADDLDGMNRAQLKALAVAIGAVAEDSKARDKSLRDAIRAKRAEAPVDGAVLNGCSSENPPPAENAKTLPSDWSVPEGQSPLQDLQDVVAVASKNTAEVYTAQAQAGEPRGFTLFIDCAPVGTDYVALSTIVAQANERLYAEKGVRDYRFIQFTGAAELCLAVRAMETEGLLDGNIVMDSRSTEGQVLINTLCDLAAQIVRGF